MCYIDEIGNLQHLENRLQKGSYCLQLSPDLSFHTNPSHLSLLGLLGEWEGKKKKKSRQILH